MDNITISTANTSQEIKNCFTVMVQLRPHFTESTFVEQVLRQQQQGYLLAYICSGQTSIAVAGYRYLENLFHGKFMYVDDLVTNKNNRSQGYGKKLFDWLVQEAIANSCTHLDLDSGVQRYSAHRFYLHNKMSITSHHFSLEL